MDHVLTIKIIVAFGIFALAFGCGRIPLHLGGVSKGSKKTLDNAASFAAGVFLGAGMMHLLPESVSVFEAHFSHTTYPWMFGVSVLTLYLLRLLQTFCESYWSDPTRHFPLLLCLMISVHALMAGIALGVSALPSNVIVIAFALFAHKGAAAFSLGVTLLRSKSSVFKINLLLGFFALMTPLGVLLGAAIGGEQQGAHGALLEAIFLAIAAGTFIYIAAFDGPLASTHQSRCQRQFSHLMYALLGIVLMASVAYWG
jgi:zinc transporter 1/2/3